jgi:hypothetical protein
VGAGFAENRTETAIERHACIGTSAYRNFREAQRKTSAYGLTDSQVFAKVSADTPPDVPLTSFSILIAHMQGILKRSLSVFPHLSALLERFDP